MNETQQISEQESRRSAKRRRRAERLTENPIQTNQNNVRAEDDNDSYIPPTPEDFKQVFSESLLSSPKAEAASALIVAALGAFAESQLGSGGVLGAMVAHALIFGGLKEYGRLQLIQKYNAEQVDENEKMKYPLHEGVISVIKSVAGPFMLKEGITHLPDIANWALDNPTFTISLVTIIAGIKNASKIGNSILNGYNAIKNGLSNAAGNFIDYVGSVRLQSPAYNFQKPVDLQSPVKFQNPIKETRSPIKESRPWFQWRSPFTRRSREGDNSGSTSTQTEEP